MRISYHSVHQPKCGVCKKHCKSFESVREHLTGPLPKADCAKFYGAQGCDLCLNVFDSTEACDAHKEMCCLSPAALHEFASTPFVENGAVTELDISGLSLSNDDDHVPEVVALDCEMVGGGSDGSLDLCGRVCIIDEDENVLFHSYVIPQIPVTNYRYEITGITEDHFKDAMTLKQVQEKVQEILYNGESIWKLRMDGGKARILVGHNLEHDLCCLRMNYPEHLMRDTAKYRPLMKTNLISHSLKYLTQTYLGYEIQTGIHDPYEDCVAVMRLYKRMRVQVHPPEAIMTSVGPHHSNVFDGWKPKELEKMSPDDLFEISRSNYRCWCLDSRQASES
ncbi:RNA exonuclease 4-like isoform X2 [Magnolia sinica]|nr:RNA exonuclease 4-like isoform X2 [Magnolia sinica]